MILMKMQLSVKHSKVTLNKLRYACIQEEVYYKELTYVRMEAEKSHNLLYVNWRPRKAGGVIQAESKA